MQGESDLVGPVTFSISSSITANTCAMFVLNFAEHSTKPQFHCLASVLPWSVDTIRSEVKSLLLATKTRGTFSNPVSFSILSLRVFTSSKENFELIE